MKTKFICMLLSLVMLLSLASVLTVSADSDVLQVCTDVIQINGEGYESTNQLSANAWFDLTYDDLLVDEDGTISTFRIRGWVNPLDESELQQYGYSLLNDEITWDDSFMAENAGLKSYFAKAERFDLTINLADVPVGTYQFRLYAKTTSGVHEVKDEAFTFEKKSMGTPLENVALNKSVTADISMEASFFGAAMLTDGLIVPFIEQTDPLGWTAAADARLLQRDQEIYIYIDLAGKYEISCVKVYPQLFLDGQGFPSSFTVLAGKDKSQMTAVASAQNVNETSADSTTDPTVLSFTPVIAKYVALRIDRASWLQEQDGSYLSEIAEVEVMGRAVALDTYTVTFKDGSTVITTVTFEEGATSITVPEVPAKDGYTGEWAAFKLEDKNIEVQAVYTEVTSTETTVETEDETIAISETTAESATQAETEADKAETTVASTGTSADDTTANGKDGKSGCGSVISASVIAFVALLGGAIVLNKRK